MLCSKDMCYLSLLWLKSHTGGGEPALRIVNRLSSAVVVRERSGGNDLELALIACNVCMLVRE